ncbi:DNA polymerase alpha subunit B N-terminal-domain-containing protein [Mrakia frigida]|uniref:DNA-directed DNA polymerase alpha subunit POL12 n=1 Tax=Mrakia frigida TaxID=29902 RepID=UPI003FCC1AFE
MDEPKSKKMLEEYFGDVVKDSPELMSECLAILRLYNLPADDLYFKWESFVLNQLKATTKAVFNLDNARELKKHIQREVSSSKGAAASAAASSSTPAFKMSTGGSKRNSGMDFLDSLSGSPSSSKKPRPSIPSASTPTLSRLSSASNATPRPVPIPGRLNFNAPSTSNNQSPSSSSRQQGSSFDGIMGSSPNGFGNGSPSAGTPSSSAKQFSTRSDALTVIESLNQHLPPSAVPAIPYEPSTTKPRIALTTGADPKSYEYRYMFEKISERSDVLDKRIDDFGELLKRTFNISDDFSDPSETSDESSYIVGQIHTDSTTKLNDSSLLLQASRSTGSGSRTPLRFTSNVVVRGGAPGVGGAGMFRGAVMGFKGRNGGGGWFLVEEILVPPAAGPSVTAASELVENQWGRKLNGEPISVFTACGPYTLDGDLDYTPFEALAEEIRTSRPDVVILLGPFVDASHPLIKLGKTDLLPVDIFRSKITSRLLDITESTPATNVILIPSVRDLISTQMAFPQGMFKRDLSMFPNPKKIRLLPNPCVLNINEVVIAVSSVDTLFHLRKETFFKKAAEAEPEPGVPTGNGDAMGNLCRSVLGQRTFYPIYPVPDEFVQDVNLDLTHLDLLNLETSPDILILPSNLAKFAKIVDSVVVVNPARLTQHHSGGTFARMVIHPSPREALEGGVRAGSGGEDENLEHFVHQRVRVDIVKI